MEQEPPKKQANLGDLAILNDLADKLAKEESRENVHYDSIKMSLAQFLRSKQEVGLDTDFTTTDVLRMMKVFNEFQEKRSQISENLSEMISKMRNSEPVEETAITELKIQIECVQETSVCLNVELIAKKLLPSSKVRAVELIYSKADRINDSPEIRMHSTINKDNIFVSARGGC